MRVVRRTGWFAGIVVALVALAPAANASDWSTFHGDAQRTGAQGVSAHGSGPSVLWTQALGQSAGSPAYANGTVYFGSVDGTLYALDAADGSRVWSSPGGGPVVDSPVVANGKVFVTTRADASHPDGFVLSRDAKTGFGGAWPGIGIPGGLDGAPTVAGGMVIVSTSKGNVAALDEKTAANKWTTYVGQTYGNHKGDGTGTPLVWNGYVYVGVYGGVAELDLASGALRRVFHLQPADTPFYVTAAPSGWNEAVLASAADGNLYAFNLPTSTKAVVLQERWHAAIGTPGGVSPQDSAPAVANGRVYVGGTSGAVYAFNVDTGTEICRYQTGQSVRSTPAVTGGAVYFGSFDGNVYAIDATTCALLWKFKADGPVDSSPAVVNGVVYVASNLGTVYALDLSGKAHATPNVTGPAPMPTNSTIPSCVSSPTPGDWPLLHLSPAHTSSRGPGGGATNASEVWRITPSNSSRSLGPLAVSNGLVFVSDSRPHQEGASTIYAVDAGTGQTRWRHDTFQAGGIPTPIGQAPLTAHITTAGDLLVATVIARGPPYSATGAQGQSLVILDARTGQPTPLAARALGTASDGWIPTSPPAIAGGAADRVVIFGAVRVHKNATTGELLPDHGDNALIAADLHTWIGSPSKLNNAVLWTAPVAGEVNAAPTVHNGVVYVATIDASNVDRRQWYAMAYAFEVRSGRAEWSQPYKSTIGLAETFSMHLAASPSVDNVSLVIGGEAVRWLQATDGTEVPSHGSGAGFGQTTVTVDGPWAFVPSYGNYALWASQTTGRVWDNAQGVASREFFQTSASLTSPPALSHGTLFLTSTDGHLYMIKESNGHQVWKVHVSGGAIDHAPAVVDGLAYVATSDGKLVAYGVGCAGSTETSAAATNSTRGTDADSSATPNFSVPMPGLLPVLALIVGVALLRSRRRGA